MRQQTVQVQRSPDVVGHLDGPRQNRPAVLRSSLGPPQPQEAAVERPLDAGHLLPRRVKAATDLQWQQQEGHGRQQP